MGGKERERETEEKKRKRKKKKQTLNYREPSDGYQRGGQWRECQWVKQVMGIQEGTCCGTFSAVWKC